MAQQKWISIHALRVEGDWIVKTLMLEGNDFYPRPPGGGRRRGLPRRADRRRISIHALRVEGDVGNILSALPAFTNFYPRPPGGGRPDNDSIELYLEHFYPRPPGGGRLDRFDDSAHDRYFYPRPPGGGRPVKVVIKK